MNDLRDPFRPVAARYRRHLRLRSVLFLLALVAIGIAAWFRVWIVALPLFAVVFLSVMVALVFAHYRPVACPGCHAAVLLDIGAHCPECGARSLVQRGRWAAKSCTACGKTLARGADHARGWRVRCCTHCGGRLDDAGI